MRDISIRTRKVVAREKGGGGGGGVNYHYFSFKEGDISTKKMTTECRGITLVPFLSG
jgi:hypothetical protein